MISVKASLLSTDEGLLLAQAKKGDPHALAALYQANATAVYSVALGILRVHADAEDVLQDVFVGLPEALHRFDARGSFVGWLKRVTVRVALMRLRRHSRRREEALLDFPLDSGNADQLISRVALEHALNRLPEKLRITFVLKEIEGYSQEETARFLGISQAAAAVRVFRAKRQLRKLLVRQE